jgi:flagellum-specific peptidoglycan hydrolase FlgJ
MSRPMIVRPVPAWLSIRKAARAVLLAAVLLGVAPVPRSLAAVDGDRFFAQTGYGVERDAFWDFFRHRGGTRTLGFPVSAAFPFQGCMVQFFQRLVLQQCGSAGVGTLNLLDDGLLPYSRINGSVFPSPDASLRSAAPGPLEDAYADKVTRFVRDNAPDTFEGEQVNFGKTFLSTVSASDAFPYGGDPALLPLINLQIWGFPTSRPQRDPSNRGFIYQRFQRGIMHYDTACRCTQGLLLADYLKALLTGQHLPPDLQADAQTSPLYRSAAPGGRPPPATSFVGAFLDPPPSPAASPSLTTDQASFIAEVGGAATRLRAQTGLPPSLMVAMAINETGWGKSTLAVQGKNYFGIKALSGMGTAGSIEVNTWEVQDGQKVAVRAPFRAYLSLDDALVDLGGFLRGNPRFASVWHQGNDPVVLARSMQQAGYATDPLWPDKLGGIIDRYGLRSLDATA